MTKIDTLVEYIRRIDRYICLDCENDSFEVYELNKKELIFACSSCGGVYETSYKEIKKK